MSHDVSTSRLSAKRWRVETYLDGLPDWEIHGSCEEPLALPYKGAPDPVMVRLKIEDDRPILGHMTVRCRKCQACLKHRSNLWAARGCDEMAMSFRTWFGTLTGSPAFHDQCLWAARAHCRSGGSGDYDALLPAEQFSHRLRVANPEVTRWLKRIRKYSDARLRYLLVCEHHKSGLPHWHMLLHETTITPVRKAMLEAQWTAGFSHWRLADHADPSAAFYVSKYLTKSLEARIRASGGYGRARQRDPIVLAKDRILEQNASHEDGKGKSAVQKKGTQISE